MNSSSKDVSMPCRQNVTLPRWSMGGGGQGNRNSDNPTRKNYYIFSGKLGILHYIIKILEIAVLE